MNAWYLLRRAALVFIGQAFAVQRCKLQEPRTCFAFSVLVYLCRMVKSATKTRILLSRIRINFDSLSEGNQVSIRGKHQQFSLPIGLVHRTVHITRGKRVQFGLEFRVELIDVANINVVRKAAIAWRCSVRALFFKQAKANCLAL